MLNRRSALFAAVALAALLVAGTAYLALRPAPHMPTFEPPSKLKPEEYESKSSAELIRLAEAGDWGALKAYAPIGWNDHGNALGPLLRRYADQGYDEARFRLGTMHLDNYDRTRDLLYNTDFLKEPIWSSRRLLENYLVRRNNDMDFASLSEAFRLLNLAAQGGHPGAQSILGTFLLKNERDSPRDIPRAMDLLERAARAGERQAAGVLCRLYYQGKLVPRDDAKCLEYARLTKNPLIPASLLVLNGRGDPATIPDALRALAEFEEKTGAKYNQPRFIQARMDLRARPAEHADEWASQRLDDEIVAPVYDAQCPGGASAWFESEPQLWAYFIPEIGTDTMDTEDGKVGACLNDALAGDKLAQYTLGCSRLVLHGDEINPKYYGNDGKLVIPLAATDADKAEGVEWLRKSAGQGFHAAMGKLGECLLRGVGVKADKVEGAYWLARATTDIHTRYAKLRDEALAALTADERAGVLRRVEATRAKIATGTAAVSPKP